MTIPQDAVIDTSKASASYHFQISLANDAVIGHLFSSPAGTNQTLEELAKRISTSETSDLKNMLLLKISKFNYSVEKPAG